MTQAELSRITEEAGHFTGPSGRPVIVLGEAEFNALLGVISGFQQYASEIIESSFVDGLSDAAVVEIGKRHKVLEIVYPAIGIDEPGGR